jgi:hypothetical protein
VRATLQALRQLKNVDMVAAKRRKQTSDVIAPSTKKKKSALGTAKTEAAAS